MNYRRAQWVFGAIGAPFLLLVVLLSLSNPVNATLGSPSSAALSIRDDEAADATFFLPIVFLGKPNDSCFTSFEILPNVEYWFLLDDSFDWFHFDLFTPANVVVELTNFVPDTGQLAVYYSEDATCSSVALIGNTNISGKTVILDMGRRPAGRYLIGIATDGPLSSTEYYRLIIHVEY